MSEQPKDLITTLRLTAEDRKLLRLLAAKEDRSAGSVLRVALRAYAAAQGVTTEDASKPKRRTRAA